ncbi:MAG: phosphate ABC transporter permease PstA [Bacteroidales bacterium]|nr:phosphate ABC transporter permease PstA [Bacteroidales bacterium]
MKNQRRKAEEKIFIQIMRIACGIIMLVMGLIIITILKKGIPALNWKILTSVPKGGFYFGGEGGILNAIIGSLYLAVGATLIAFVISTPTSLFLNVHLKKYFKLQNAIRLFIDVLWGVPSVVYGAFAFSVMIYFGLRASLLAGILTVSIFISPIMIRSMDESLKTVPLNLYEAALSLGSTKFEIAYKIFFKKGIPGIATAILLSFGRAIGDAASVLFTTGFTDNIPKSLTQPAATLPLSIFFQLSSPIPEVQDRAYAAAVVLTIIILLISITGRTISQKFTKNDIK